MGRAKYVYVVMDGAIWLWDLVEDRSRSPTRFSHARDHLGGPPHATPAKVMRPRGSCTASPEPVERKPESQGTDRTGGEVLLWNICTTRRWRKRVLHGGGAIESLGKQLQQRLKAVVRMGQTGLHPPVKVVVLVKNQDDHLLWN